MHENFRGFKVLPTKSPKKKPAQAQGSRRENLSSNPKLTKPAKSPKSKSALDLGEEAAQNILTFIGEDASREGLLRTPHRFAKALAELTEGYHLSVHEIVGQGVFRAEGSGLVSIRKIEFYSLCEHHLLPFWGTMSVAYYPRDKIVGLSKIPRIVNLFSRRLQVQERLTNQVADAMVEILDPRAVAVRANACHLCMMMRGVEKQQSETLTETVRGLENLEPFERERLWESLGS